MKKLALWAVAVMAVGFWIESNATIGVGTLLLLAVGAWYVLVGAKKGIVAGAGLAASKVREHQAEKREEREHQKQLRRELERIETIEKARASQQLDMYRKQIEILAEYKKKEGDITAELLAMRRKLLEFESQENAAMVQNLLRTLDSI